MSDDAAGDVQLVQLLTPEGERLEHPEYAFAGDDELIKGFLTDMVLTRRIDAEAIALQRQGELGIWPSCLGQEAAQIGSGRAMLSQDYAFPTYREHGVAWCRGRRPAAAARPLPRGRPRLLGPGAARLPPVHDRHRRPGAARHRVRHGGRARRRRRHRQPGPGHRGDRLLRRRGDQPGRRERGVRLRQLLQRPDRLLLPEQPVGDLRADRAAVADPAVPARGRLRLPRRTGGRQRRARRARGDHRRPGAGPVGQRADADRGLHLPDGRPHHLRRPDQVPAGRRAGALAAEGPDRAGQGLPEPARGGRRRVLRAAWTRRRRPWPATCAPPAWRSRRRGWSTPSTEVYAGQTPHLAEQQAAYADYLATFADAGSPA